MDKWLDKNALKDQDLGISCTHVWVDASEEMVVGYYTLLPTTVREEDGAGLWARLKPSKQYWGSEFYGVLIGKLALDASLQGQGLSIELIGEAIFTAIEAINAIGGVYVVIEPMDNDPGLRSLYERYGFHTTEGTDRMYLSVPDFCAGGVPI